MNGDHVKKARPPPRPNRRRIVGTTGLGDKKNDASRRPAEEFPVISHAAGIYL
jgi:hypothetical protein